MSSYLIIILWNTYNKTTRFYEITPSIKPVNAQGLIGATTFSTVLVKPKGYILVSWALVEYKRLLIKFKWLERILTRVFLSKYLRVYLISDHDESYKLPSTLCSFTTYFITLFAILPPPSLPCFLIPLDLIFALNIFLYKAFGYYFPYMQLGDPSGPLRGPYFIQGRKIHSNATRSYT